MAPRPTSSDLPPAMLALARGEAGLAELLEMSPRVLEQLVEQALGLAEAGRTQEAEALLTQLALVEAQTPLLPMLLGTVRAERGLHEAAVAAYDEALARHVRAGGHVRFEVEVRLLKGRALLALARDDEAQVELLLAAAGPDPAVARGARALLRARP